jgi:precorrin-4 methylase
VAGALIGGAAGAAGGALVGSQINKPAGTVQQPGSAQAAEAPLTMQQIVDMTRQGVTSDQIIARIQSAHSTYVLNADDVSYLRQNGVSQRVIEFMQASK